MSERPSVGVYVHVPWCRQRCPYCDFAIAIAPLDAIPHDAYADALLVELAGRSPLYAGHELTSIYFGGGTPALLEPTALARVIGGVRAAFDATGAALEITVEANPLDATPDRLAALRAAGVDRLSLGVQSFDDATLGALGRDHDGAAGAAAVRAARTAGFARISMDLICAVPDRGTAALDADLARTIALAPDHVSCYQLTIEPRTPFGEAARAGRLVPVTDEQGAAELELAHARLEGAGYEHYEVSSFAQPGARARHNASYWRGVPYLGLGAGAASLWRGAGGGVRWTGKRAVNAYLAGAQTDAASVWTAPPEPRALAAALARDPRIELGSVEPQDAAALDADALWLGLRTTDGVPAEALGGREAVVARLAGAGLLDASPTRVRPTARGLLYADQLGVELLP